jgi:hypothetical protein
MIDERWLIDIFVVRILVLNIVKTSNRVFINVLYYTIPNQWKNLNK